MCTIDLNMVRAGAVAHPAEWAWCGYSELIGVRKRYRLLDMELVLQVQQNADTPAFAETYRAAINERVAAGGLGREPQWTESIAVGSEAFVTHMAQKTWVRQKLDRAEIGEGQWILREVQKEEYRVPAGTDSLESKNRAGNRR